MMLRAAEPHTRILPFHRLLLLLSGCVGLSWLMVPRQGELIDRLIKDHQYDRVVAVLQDHAADRKPADASNLKELSTEQLATLSNLVKLTPREQLAGVFEGRGVPVYDNYVHNIVLGAIRFVDVIPPSEAYDLIAPHLDRVPYAMRADLLGLIARNAQALNQADVAARALEKTIESGEASWPIVVEMVKCLRWSGQSARAATELKKWLALHRDHLDASELTTAHSLRYALALESGKPGDALDTCLAMLESNALPNDALRSWVERAHTVALQSSRTKELIPGAMKYVASLPESRLALPQLRAEHQSDPSRFDELKRWLTNVAHWSDWNSAFPSAFDAHLKLAAMGEAASVDRCLALYEHLGRTEDAAALLELVGPIPGRERASLTLAQLLAEMGEDDKARIKFEAWLHEHPGDRDAQYNYACLLEDMGDEGGSRRAFEATLTGHPQDVPAMKRLAKACIRDADYDAALKLYEALPATDHDPETLENYALIAESLDNYLAKFTALQLTAKSMKQPAPEFYLDMAEAASHLPDDQPAIDTLNDGLGRLPHSAVLRVALADAYFEADRPEDALATLLNDELKQNFPAIRSLLAMGEELQEPVKVLEFLGSDLDQRFALSPRQRLQFAVLNYQAGKTAVSERLFATVKEAPGTLQMLADAHFRIGDFDEAARLQRTYLQNHAHATASDWTFLGDICEQMGNFVEAKKAYDFSLALLTADIPGATPN